MLDEQEFLSPYGLRALSRRHADRPFMLDLAGASYAVDYEPGESTTGLFGGNSNWRGPIWFPVNYLIIDALHRYARFFGDDILVEYPTGSGRKVTLTVLADDLARRLVSIFLDDEYGRRPVFGDVDLFQTHPDWHNLLPFHEYFHGDTGRGVGASHQTGLDRAGRRPGHAHRRPRHAGKPCHDWPSRTRSHLIRDRRASADGHVADLATGSGFRPARRIRHTGSLPTPTGRPRRRRPEHPHRPRGSLDQARYEPAG
jgi:hypothetical protein